MADVQLSLQLTGIQQAQAELAKLDGSFKGLGNALAPVGAKLSELGGSLASFGAKATLIAAPIALAGKSLISAGADFEAAMLKLGASSGATAEQMAAVSAAAKDIGATTVFSAGEAATGFQALVTTGVSLKDSLGGVMEATVLLAAATKTDLGTSAEIAGDIMKSFNITASEMPTALNQVYNATIQSKFGLEDMRYALANTGAAAMSLHVPFNELNAFLATTSSGFASGTTAGTSMSYFLQNLVPQTKAAKSEMKELGLYSLETGNAFFTQDGKLKSLAEVQRIATEAFSKLTDEQRIQSAAIIFGQQGQDTLNQILIQGVDAYGRNLEAINKHNTALAAAKALMQGFWGAIDQLGGAIELVGIALAESGFLEFLTNMVLKLSDAIVWVSKLPGPILNLGAGIAAVTVVIGPLVLAIGGMLSVLGAVLPAVGAVIAVFGAILSPIALIGVAVVALIAGFVALTTNAFGLRDRMLEVFNSIVANAAAWRDALVARLTEIMAGFANLVAAVLAWAPSFIAAVAGAVLQAGAALITGIQQWGPGALAAIVALMGSLLQTMVGVLERIGPLIAQAGAALVAGIVQWGPGALAATGQLITSIIGGLARLVAAIVPLISQAGQAFIDGLIKWGPRAIEAVGFIIGQIIGAFAKLVIALADVAIDAAASLFNSFRSSAEGADWGSVITNVLTFIGRALEGLATYAINAGIALAKGILRGLSEAFGADIVGIVAGMGTKITSALASLPAKIAGIFKSVKEGAVAEATEMQDTLVTHSVFPEIAEGAIDAMFRMKGGVIENVTKMAAETTQKFEEMASTIADSDWGIDKKMSAFSQLRESMAKAGNVGTKAFSALEKTIQDTSRAAVSAKLDEIMNDVTLSLGEQIAQVKGVQTEWAKYGTAGSSANKEILATLQGLNAELANNQIDELLDDTTLSLEDQIAALDQSADYYSAMGADGKKALVQIEGASADLSKELKKNSSVLHGVGTAIEDNNRAWGGWGRSSERIVGAFAQNSEAALSNFFMTGKFNIQDFGAQMKQTFADEAAKFVVNFALQGIKSIVMWGASMFTSTTTATVGLHGTTTAAWGLNAAMAPMLLVVLAIAAALAILYFAGVDLGDLFKGLMSIVGSFGKLLFSGILVVVNLIVGAFKALVGLLETFVKWIKTIGDELGKGDLKDLFKIFGGGFGGIFKGIGSFFGGLFQEGGPIEGSGPVPIVAHGGEFVVNARSSDQYRPLLEAINDSQAPFRAFAAGGDMMLTRPTLLLGGEAGPESVSFTKGGRNANAGPVNINGPIISSDITMGQFARKLGVRMELEQRRKRGG